MIARSDFNILFSIDWHSCTRRSLVYSGSILDLDAAMRPGYPMRTLEREWNNPNTLRSQSTTQMTTTAFKIDLILPAMGMNWFTNHRRTPTTIRTTKI